MFDIFRFTAEKALAKNISEYLRKNVPPKMMGQKRQVLSANRISRILEQAFVFAEEYKDKSRPGFIRRAVLANSLRWELSDQGYPADFVGVVVEGLIVELSKKHASKAG